MMGTTCTDVHPVEHAQAGRAFFCSKCPAGYEKNYGICVGKMVGVQHSYRVLQYYGSNYAISL